jgi:type II secretory pathway pseudopilin PulG
MKIKEQQQRETGDEGYMLLAVLVLVFLVLLTLSVAAPKIAMALKRDRELETQHRAQQYVRAIRLYYRKFHNYPSSIDQLEKTNNQRFLRQRYLDPLTGKDDWRLIAVGQNKTTVKGFFGKDLPGIAGGLGAAAGLQSGNGSNAGLGGSPANSSGSSTFGSNGGSAFNNSGVGGGGGLSSGQSGSAFGAGSQSGSSFGSNSPSVTTGTTAPGTGTGTGTGTSGVNSQDATTFGGGGTGQIMGIGVPATGEALLTVNEKNDYNEWEFLYDPRIEALYNKGATQGATGAAAGGGLGNGQAPTGLPSQNGTAPFGTQPTQPGTATPAPGTPSQPNTPP